MKDYKIINVSNPNRDGYVQITAMHKLGFTYVYTTHVDIINKRKQ
jgi:hypothetical protein